MNRRPVTEDDLHAYVDGALDSARREEIALYLEGHPEVALRVEDYRRQRQELRDAFAPVAEEPLPPELTLSHLVERQRAPVRPAHWQRALQIAAAVLLLLAGGAGGWSLHALQPGAAFFTTNGAAPTEGIAALAQEASYNYAVFAADRQRPVELRADSRSELQSWASARLGHPVSAPDLAASGYRFMGGRMVATPHGAAVLFLYDDDKGSRLALLSRPMAADQNAPMTALDTDSLRGFSWAKDGIGFSLVGSVTATALHPLADEVRRQLSPNI
jgi:anti-sigma factor RsiW